jgi:hypothetical protein
LARGGLSRDCTLGILVEALVVNRCSAMAAQFVNNVRLIAVTTMAFRPFFPVSGVTILVNCLGAWLRLTVKDRQLIVAVGEGSPYSPRCGRPGLKPGKKGRIGVERT